MTGPHSAVSIKDEWLTPPELLEQLGPFDLDPCAPVERPWGTALEHYTIEDDGLDPLLPWHGRVWCNPPYTRSRPWLARLAEHGDGVALIFARTETETFFSTVWERAGAVLFIRGRLFFHHVTGQRATANGGAPSVLVAYGQRNVACLKWCGVPGQFLELARR